MFDSLTGDHRRFTWVLRFWCVPAVAFAGSVAATALCRQVAIHFGIMRRPDNAVKTYNEPTANVSGVGMLIGLTVAICHGPARLYALIGLAMSPIRMCYAAVACILVVRRKGYLRMHGLRSSCREHGVSNRKQSKHEARSTKSETSSKHQAPLTETLSRFGGSRFGTLDFDHSWLFRMFFGSEGVIQSITVRYSVSSANMTTPS